MVETNRYNPRLKKSYSELIKLKTFEERFDYLALHGIVGAETFGSNRFLNQDFYRRSEWKKARRLVIIRDSACDLGILDRPIDHYIDEFGRIINNGQRVYVHHINPVTVEDVVNPSPILFDPENLICVSHLTHEAIHYGDKSLLFLGLTERKPNDTCPWKTRS